MYFLDGIYAGLMVTSVTTLDMLIYHVRIPIKVICKFFLPYFALLENVLRKLIWFNGNQTASNIHFENTRRWFMESSNGLKKIHCDFPLRKGIKSLLISYTYIYHNLGTFPEKWANRHSQMNSMKTFVENSFSKIADEWEIGDLLSNIAILKPELNWSPSCCLYRRTGNWSSVLARFP